MKCGGGGGVKVGGNLLSAVYSVRNGVWSCGRKVLFSGEFDMAFVQVPTDGINC